VITVTDSQGRFFSLNIFAFVRQTLRLSKLSLALSGFLLRPNADYPAI